MENIFPTITLTSQQLREINSWPVGSQYKLEITVEMTGKRQAEQYDIPTVDASEGGMAKNNVMVGSFKIIDVQPCDDNKEEGDDIASYEDDYAMKRSGEGKEQTITIKLVK
jgi:hypothetical protein